MILFVVNGQVAVASGSGRTAIFDGELLTVQAGRERKVETKIPVSDIKLISFVRKPTHGYLVVHATVGSVRIEFRRGQAPAFEQLKDVVELAILGRPSQSEATPKETQVRKGVDPAALLVAVVVVAVGSLLGAGSWGVLDTVVAVTVLAIFFAYSPTPPTQLPDRRRERFAVALAFILLCAVTLAWPIQLIIVIWHLFGGGSEARADLASYFGVGIGVIVSALWLWLPRRGRSGPRDEISRSLGRSHKDRPLWHD
jgi:hypothetical protein